MALGDKAAGTPQVAAAAGRNPLLPSMPPERQLHRVPVDRHPW